MTLGPPGSVAAAELLSLRRTAVCTRGDQFLWSLILYPPSCLFCCQALPITVGEKRTSSSHQVTSGPPWFRAPAQPQFAATNSPAQYKKLPALHFICNHPEQLPMTLRSSQEYLFHCISFLHHQLVGSIEILTWRKIFLSQVHATRIKRVSKVTPMTLVKTTDLSRQ